MDMGSHKDKEDMEDKRNQIQVLELTMPLLQDQLRTVIQTQIQMVDLYQIPASQNRNLERSFDLMG